MIGRRGSTRSRGVAAVSRAAVGACALALAFSAFAQEVPAPSPAPAPVPGQPPADTPSTTPAAPSSAFKPGFIDVLGRWFEESATRFKSGLQGAEERFDRFNKQARDSASEATGTIMGLPNTRIVTARERCLPAPNGAPDCQSAANALCRGKGLRTGKSLDTRSEQKCPAKVLLEGRAPNDAECATEIFVTRAVCQ